MEVDEAEILYKNRLQCAAGLWLAGRASSPCLCPLHTPHHTVQAGEPQNVQAVGRPPLAGGTVGMRRGVQSRPSIGMCLNVPGN